MELYICAGLIIAAVVFLIALGSKVNKLEKEKAELINNDEAMSQTVANLVGIMVISNERVKKLTTTTNKTVIKSLNENKVIEVTEMVDDLLKGLQEAGIISIIRSEDFNGAGSNKTN